ncbi:MAG: hypothetical protein JNL79_13705 [Myxococcales bacterium]|nr:hypothetical protein [Myxococcales bacterium]
MWNSIAAVLVVALCLGCSSPSPGASPSPEATHAIPTALAGTCTGKLLLARTSKSADADGRWTATGPTLPPGTPFVVDVSFYQFGGIAFSDGAPLRLDIEPEKGLVRGTDFESSCAAEPDGDKASLVIVRASKVFPYIDLSGAPCTLPVGARFYRYRYLSTGTGTSRLEASQLTSACGFETGYTAGLTSGRLLPE